MKNYFVNRHAQANGDHEVHHEKCSFLPSGFNRIYLGAFISCQGAVKEARKHYTQSNGCYHCSNECHTR